ncbi:uncharacterized protein At1g28695-like [Andrographis paniculata]|uniref:uncharacterized protein At1g28695-like n=1 Tax=Andrographis paniculata TaxID=175694 RepID=UPI0021E8E875|nr:uncharacterized protein At1g28695-like [Andrographis paniculata]
MDYSKYSTNLAILSLLLATVILLCSRQNLSYKSLIFSSENSPKDDLQIALERASTPEKTLIIVVINEAYVEPIENEYPTMFDIFLEGFWIGDGVRSLVDHLLVVAMDEKAYNRCEYRRMNCYKLAAAADGEAFAGEKVYMSNEFIEMMWRRTAFLLDVLGRGYSFIFTDADVLWLRNPFKKLSSSGSHDLEISVDKFNGDESSMANPINTGFYHVWSNDRTVSLFRAWHEGRRNSTGLKEQDVLLKMVRRGALWKLGVRTRFLDTLYFSGFCRDSKDVESVATVHANCCRTIKAKVLDLKKVLADWRRFKTEGVVNKTAGFTWTAHGACMRSWKSKG